MGTYIHTKTMSWRGHQRCLERDTKRRLTGDTIRRQKLAWKCKTLCQHFRLQALSNCSIKTDATVLFSSPRIWASQDAAMLVRSSLTRRSLARDVMYTSAVCAGFAHNVSDLVKMTSCMVTFWQLSNLLLFPINRPETNWKTASFFLKLFF